MMVVYAVPTSDERYVSHLEILVLSLVWRCFHGSYPQTYG